MDKNQDKPEEQLVEEPQSAEVKKPELGKISKEELKKTLQDHLKYLESEGKDGKIANLYKADLSEADLSEAELSEAELGEANLGRANLGRANLWMANSYKADLGEANLDRANLGRTNLWMANLNGASLNGADLRGADLRKANLTGANLTGADIREARLNEANLTGANLFEANISEADLREAILTGADLRGAHLNEANLGRANLWRAHLHRANLYKVDLAKADLGRTNPSAVLYEADLGRAHLSGEDFRGATVNESTLDTTRKIMGGQVGVNGIWAERSDSAALMAVTPPGNSMQGSNPDAVIESLIRARRLNGFSMSLVGIIILIAVLNLTEIKFPWAENVKVTPSQFGLLAMPMSIGLLVLIGSFMSDALKGAQYLQDRSSAMSVGNFPWSLSKYSGKGAQNSQDPSFVMSVGNFSWSLSNSFVEDKIAQFLSCVIRMVMSFHPITYIFILGIWQVFNPVVFYVLSIITLILSGWVLYLSEQFQKPILFDRRTEEEKKDNIEKLTVVVKELVDILKPKENNKTITNESDGDSSNGTKSR